MVPIFSTFIDITSGQTDQMIDYAKDLITDISPLLIIILAVGLGAIIVSVIIHAIKK